jgi:hypothetical protein
MATMIPGHIEEFGTEGEKAFYPGSGKRRPLAGMSPRLGVRSTPPALPVGLHKFLEGVAKPFGLYGSLSYWVHRPS